MVCCCSQNFNMMQNLYFFNSDNEMAIANGRISYTPPVKIMKMMNDLAFLPAFLADKGDFVLLNSPLADCFKKECEVFPGLVESGITWEEADRIFFDELRPWGWSPRVHYVLKKLKSQCKKEFTESIMGEWGPGREEWYSRRKVIDYFHILRSYMDFSDELVPVVCYSVEEVKRLSEKGSIVVKSPWSSSGRGVFMLEKGKLTSKTIEWMNGIFHRQKYVMVEKMWDKVWDFAMEFEIDGNGISSFLGLSDFYVGGEGGYKGNYVGKQEKIEEKITRYVGKKDFLVLRDTVNLVIERLYGKNYIGCLGVDMMIYRDERGEYRIHPCVEINLRYTMGIVALSLFRHYMAEESEGVFQVQCFSRQGEAYRYYLETKRDFPLIVEEGRIVSGCLSLTPVLEDTIFIANLLVNGR